MNSLIATALIGWLACSSLVAAGLTTGSTALFRAIRDGDSAAVRKLLKARVDLQSRNEAGDTPLMSAVVTECSWQCFKVAATSPGIKGEAT
jgi:hypothetical protein